MASCPEISDETILVSAADSQRPEESSSPPPTDINHDTFASILGGVTLAGGVYSAFLYLIYLCVFVFIAFFALAQGNTRIFQEPELLLAIPMSLVGLSISIIAGIVWAGVVAIFTLPVVFLFVWTLGIRTNVIRLGATCGAMTGFVAVLPPILFGFPFLHWMDLIGWFIIGPAITTPIGQLGGAWGGSNAKLKSWPAEGNRAARAMNGRFQFDLRQLLWFSTWVGLLLAGLRLVGLPFEMILPLLAGWLVYQSATLAFGWLVICRLWPWWRARRAQRFT